LSIATEAILWPGDTTVKQLNSINIIGIGDLKVADIKKAPGAKLQRLFKYF